MEEDAQIKLKSVRVDGGMVANELLMQFQADILNREVVRPVVQETTALGAAYAAGLAVGFYNGLDELCAKWKSDRVWKPQMAEADRNRLYHGWKKAVTRSFDWIQNQKGELDALSLAGRIPRNDDPHLAGLRRRGGPVPLIN